MPKVELKDKAKRSAVKAGKQINRSAQELKVAYQSGTSMERCAQQKQKMKAKTLLLRDSSSVYMSRAGERLIAPFVVDFTGMELDTDELDSLA